VPRLREGSKETKDGEGAFCQCSKVSKVEVEGVEVEASKGLLQKARSFHSSGAAEIAIFPTTSRRNPDETARGDLCKAVMHADRRRNGRLVERSDWRRDRNPQGIRFGLAGARLSLADGLALERKGFKVEFERPLSIEFDGKVIERAYIIDIVVENKVLIEIKSVATLLPIHFAQVKTYLKLSKLPVGLLMNFNVEIMKNGIKRILHPDLER